MIPAGLRLVGSGPLGRVPPAIFSIRANCAGLGLGKPSVVGMVYGAAAVLAIAADRANRFLKYKLVGFGGKKERNWTFRKCLYVLMKL